MVRTFAAVCMISACMLLVRMACTRVLAETGHNETAQQHALAMHGKASLPQGFKALPYANPDAPKGGLLVLGRVGTFDSLNPFIVKGVTPPNILGYVYESLMARSTDEPFTLYGLLAEKIEMPQDRSTITFHLHPQARFSDGKSVTAQDVKFSFELLKKSGKPYMRSHYGKVARVEILSEREIRFAFKPQGDREIPLIMGLMPVLPQHAISAETFERTTLQPPVGSGPYIISTVNPGHSLAYTRNPDYWGRDIPSRRGHFNFDTIRIDYFRNSAALFEGFKSGKVDYRRETDPARWIDSYDFPAIANDSIRRYGFKTGLPAGMSGLVFNTRRRQLADRRVRQALILAFDARRINDQMFHGRYTRANSYFSGSDLASSGRPASRLEQAMLAPFPNAVRADILAGTWRPPSADNAQEQRANLKKAFDLLRAAGFKLAGRTLIDAKSGQPFGLEFLVVTGEQERLVLAYSQTLKRLGIAVSVRLVEDTQYWARLGNFDFDIIQWTYGASLSPGNEQIHRWNSRYADIKRSFNYAGVKSAAADHLIEAMLAATERKQFEAAVRAFDRVLLSGDYVIPLFHEEKQWIAANARLAFPERQPLFGVNLNTWWFKE